MQSITSRLRHIHTFLLRESFYTLVFATFLACTILIGRLYMTRTWLYLFLSWNLFLAWIPYLCSLLVRVIHHYQPRRWWLLLPPTALWLLFFPNAPYIVTDLIHLNRNWDFPLWYDVGLIATFAWIGCFLAVASLHSMQRVVRTLAGQLMSWLFVFTSILLSGLGVYLGRFLRWNSWDILYDPSLILYDAITPFLNPTQNLQAVGVTLMFSAFLLICYLTFIAARGNHDTPTGQQAKGEFTWEKQSDFVLSDEPVVFAPTTPFSSTPSERPRQASNKQPPRSSSDSEWVFDWG